MYKNLKLGDVVWISLWGFWKHYGIVVQEGDLFQEPVIRTVDWNNQKPINQTLFEFCNGSEYQKIDYPSRLSGALVVQNAINIKEFDYSLLTNNCENFWRQAHGLSNISTQVLVSVTVASLALMLVTKKIKLPVI